MHVCTLAFIRLFSYRVTGHSAGGAVGAYTAMVLEVRTHRTYIAILSQIAFVVNTFYDVA